MGSLGEGTFAGPLSRASLGVPSVDFTRLSLSWPSSHPIQGALSQHCPYLIPLAPATTLVNDNVTKALAHCFGVAQPLRLTVCPSASSPSPLPPPPSKHSILRTPSILVPPSSARPAARIPFPLFFLIRTNRSWAHRPPIIQSPVLPTSSLSSFARHLDE